MSVPSFAVAPSVPAPSRAERMGTAVWATACALVILLPHLLHYRRYGSDALPLADGVDAPMYQVLAARAPSPAAGTDFYLHAIFADSGHPLTRRYISLGWFAWLASCVGAGGGRLFLLMDLISPLAFFWLLNRWLRELGTPWSIRTAGCVWFTLCHTWFIQFVYYLWRGHLDVLFLHLNRPLNPQWSLLAYTGAAYLMYRQALTPSARLQATSGALGLYAQTIQGPYLAGSFWFAWLIQGIAHWRRRELRILGFQAAWAVAAVVLMAMLVAVEWVPGRPLVPTPAEFSLQPPPYRTPLLSIPVLAAILVGVGLAITGSRNDPAVRVILGLHAGTILAANQHVLTGMFLNPGHFLRPLKVTLLLTACLLVVHGARRIGRVGALEGRWMRAAGFILCALFVANGVFVQTRSFASARRDYDSLQDYRDPLRWLARQPHGVVSCAPRELLQTAVLLETPHAVLTYQAAHHLGASPAEMVSRWTFDHLLRGVDDPGELRRKAFTDRGVWPALSLNLTLYRDLYGLDNGREERLLRDLIDRFVTATCESPPPFRVDYVIEGPLEREAVGGPIGSLPHLVRIYPASGGREGEVRIYRVDRDRFGGGHGR